MVREGFQKNTKLWSFAITQGWVQTSNKNKLCITIFIFIVSSNIAYFISISLKNDDPISSGFVLSEYFQFFIPFLLHSICVTTILELEKIVEGRKQYFLWCQISITRKYGGPMPPPFLCGIWYENGIHRVFAYVSYASRSGCLQRSASIPCHTYYFMCVF